MAAPPFPTAVAGGPAHAGRPDGRAALPRWTPLTGARESHHDHAVLDPDGVLDQSGAGGVDPGPAAGVELPEVGGAGEHPGLEVALGERRGLVGATVLVGPQLR